MFILVDCNNFYVSCERVFRPDLEEKPVLVLSNNDGCVISRSQEVKRLGIKMGEPLFKCKPLVKEQGVTVFSSNFSLYADFSHRVMEVLKQFSSEIEIYSIDEAFLFYTHKNPTQLGLDIKKRVKRYTGIPVSVGIGKTKTLAKLANYFAKKLDLGVCVYEQFHEDHMLKQVPVDEIWGIGRQHRKCLYKHGVHTAFGFKNLPETWVKKHLHLPGFRTQLELKGTSCISLDLVCEKRKSIVSSRSFGKKIYHYSDLKAALVSNLVRAGEKLREERQLAGAMTIFIQSSPFSKHPYRMSNRIHFPQHSASTTQFIEYVDALLTSIFKEDVSYSKSGILLYDFVSCNQGRVGLFNEDKGYIASERAMSVIDAINHTWGRHTIKPAILGGKQGWAMSQSHKSPRYTTSWHEIPLVY